MDVEGGDGRRRGPDGKESEMSKRGFVGWSSSVVALVALWAFAGSAGSAWAGEYHVYGCRMPDGQVAPTDGWSGSTAGVVGYVENGCSEDGELFAALGDGSTHAATTDIATWTFTAPPGDALVDATLWRAGDADGGLATNATYEFWLAGPDETKVFDECVYEFGCQLGLGEPADALSSLNRVVVPVANLGANLYLNASCGGVPTYKCPSGKGDTNGYAAVVYLYASDLVLQQSSQPSISGVEGELATASTLAGTSDLAFHAEDPGSGVYQAVFTIDGSEVGRTVLGENGGHCHDVGQTTDGLPAFLYLQPCAPSLTVDLPFDTTMLTDGTHHLVVSITNASGNSTVALDRKVTIANHPSVTPPQQTPTQQQSSSEGQGSADATKNDPSSHTNPVPQLGSANGTNASAGATLHVRWSSTAKASLAASYGHAQTVLGHLLAPSGASIVGASIQVISTPSFQGAHPVALASAVTASDGSFRVRLPAATPSSRLTFAYSSHLGQPSPDVLATLALTVPARLSLRVTPRTSHAGGRIAFTGTLSGSPLPPGGKQIVLEARTPTGPWRQFRVLSTVAHGRYRATYRFRLAGPILYEFRAVSRREADFPYATGASGSVRVHEH
jgi:hypothetical protein